MIEQSPNSTFTTFDGHRLIATGALRENALALKRALESGSLRPILIFDDATGRTVEVDTRGTDEECCGRLAALWPPHAPALAGEAAEETAQPRGRGRPKLGVVPREVTLLPRHWAWLDTQPGGSSVALRKLVEEARRQSSEKDQVRRALDRAYQFMVTLAGDLPGFEEASRALFANDAVRMRGLLSAWPRDVCAHVMRLAWGDEGAAATVASAEPERQP
ncbi:MAG: DUF2239 family protein [Prosthecobacter sp.]|uniref:DUF2239 family protein n=1 Tax=Prosthecobacter sp. TaxID=1965333 RepID=UPI0025EB84DC|nr:DUF2239 family protein [Prosthecobacter sp.]MCF7784945.1 DUF2239 family protein [Prosthecobacter sp.]